MKTQYFYLFALLAIINLSAQDSLYLVKTLEGQTSNRLDNAAKAGDINGDGYSDLAVSYLHVNSSTLFTHIYFGNPDFELEPDITTNTGKSFPGDINNDGYSDIIIRERTWLDEYESIDTLYLNYGGSEIDTTKHLIYGQQYFRKGIGGTDPIGDVNGNGYKDLAVASPYNWGNGVSFVYLFLGGDTVSSEPFVTFYHSPWEDSTSEGTFGRAVSGVGDVNNDGYDDIMIGDPKNNGVSTGPGKVYLYYGGENMDNAADTILTNDSDPNFGTYIQNGGDINNDGGNTLVIVSLGNVYFYKGLEQYSKINASKFEYGGHINVGSGGDINKDGYDDFIIGNTNHRNKDDIMVGGAFIYYGSADEDTLHDYTLEGEHNFNQFSYQCEVIGDFNGDGFDDFIILAPRYPVPDNVKGKLYLYSYKKLTGINEPKTAIINNFELHQNYPNPFNPDTRISYSLPITSDVKLKIYNITGKEVITLVSKRQSGGRYHVTWDGKNRNGAAVSTGVYFYELIAGKTRLYKKMIMLH